MPVTFLYKDKTYTTNNFESKLVKMGITKDDVKICKKIDCAIGEPDPDRKTYKFYNPYTKETIVSIYKDLSHLYGIINLQEWQEIE